MGMFDSFYITDLANNQIEIQTKQLDCQLNGYGIGDIVPHYNKYGSYFTDNYFLIEEYFPPLTEDDEVDAEEVYVGLIVVHNIFIDYIAGDFRKKDIGNLEQSCQKMLDSYINNPQALLLKFERIIKEHLLKRISNYQTTINEIKETIHINKLMQSKKEPLFLSNEARKKQLESGLEPLIIISNIINNKDDIKLFES